jgi:uncharacterized membrane protein
MHLEPRIRAWRLSSAAVLAGALLLILVAVASLLQAFAGIVVVFLPSYLIVWPALRPRLGSAGAFTVAGGLSIGMIAIGGLLLNLLPWGLQAATWLAYLLVLLVIALAIGRRPGAWRPRLGAARHEVVLGGAGAAMVVTALLFARLFAGHPTESFTQVWITPSADAPASVELRMLSEEQAATGYRMEVWRNGAQVESWTDIRLVTGQTWSRTVSVGAGRIEVLLFRLTDPGTLYRYVTLELGGSALSPVRGGA